MTDFSISHDGRYVAYTSDAGDLVPGDANNNTDVFVRDLQAGTTALVTVSVSKPGVPAVSSNGYNSRISGDGKFVAFMGYSNDWIAGETSYSQGVYVRDLQANVTYRASVTTSGATSPVPLSGFEALAVSRDGHRVAFVTSSSLSPADQNGTSDVYLWDMDARRTTLVSESLTGGGGNGQSRRVVISADGTAVAFESDASNLAPGDTNNALDVFVYRTADQSLTLASARSDGLPGGGASYNPLLSADGLTVAFNSTANDLIDGDTNNSGDTFVRNLRPGGGLALVSARPDGAPVDGYTTLESISDDGTRIVFSGSVTNAVAGVTVSGTNAFVRNTQNGTTILVGRNAAGTGAGNGPVSGPRISADGSTVTFVSTATDLVSGAAYSGGPWNVFARDLNSNSTRLVSRTGPLAGRGGESSYPIPSVSGDGAVVAFGSPAAGLVAEDNNRAIDAFVDRFGTVSLVSGRATTQQHLTGAGASQYGSTSGDGRYVVFQSRATNLVPSTGGLYASTDRIYLRDLGTGTTRLLSVRPDGTPAGGQFPTITADGRTVAFTSYDNLVAGQQNLGIHAYVLDLQTGAFRLASVRPGGPSGDYTYVNTATISPDGRYVAFSTYSNAFAAGDTNGQSDVFVRDLVLNETRLVSANHLGTGTANQQSDNFAFSGDGKKLVFQSYASDIVANDANQSSDLFLHDLATGANTPVSSNTANSGTANALSYAQTPTLSADGRYVGFNSNATDLFAGQPGDVVSGAYVRDTVAGVTRPVSVGPDGQVKFGFAPVVSADGRYAVFASNDGGLVAGASSSHLQFYRRDLEAGVTELVTVAADGLTPSATSVDPNYLHVSSDGRYVAFVSAAADLAAGNEVGQRNVFVRDMQAGTTALASATATGVGIAPTTPPTYLSLNVYGMSGDGNTVTFATDSASLLPEDRNFAFDVFAYQRFVRRGTSTTVTSSASVVLAGQPVTLRAAVTAAGATPTGRVAFTDGDTPLGEADLGPDGTATVTIAALPVGSHAVRAHFLGGTDLYPSASVSTAVTVIQDAVVVSLQANPASAAVGTAVTLTATLTRSTTGGPAPSGHVTFSYAGTVVGQAAVGADGKAVLTTTTIPAGVHPVVATYTGDQTYSPVSSNPLVVTVTRLTPEMYASPDATATVYGQPILYSVAIYTYEPNRPAPTGSVTFREGQTVLGRAQLFSSSYQPGYAQANFYIPVRLAPGTHPIAIEYAGDGVFEPAAQSSTQTVSAFGTADPHLQLISAADPARTGDTPAGQSVAPSVSADGRYVVFLSDAGNLTVDNSHPNKNNFNAYVKDLQTGTVRLVNVGPSGEPGGDVRSAVISGDGRYVAFQSSYTAAPNIGYGYHIYLRDLEAGTTVLVSTPRPGTNPNYAVSGNPRISADGRYVAFSSTSPWLVADDQNNADDVFRWDRNSGSIQLVSVQAPEVGTASGNSVSAAYYDPDALRMSDDGRFVVFSSYASDLVAGDDNNSQDVFVRDMTTGVTSLVSVRRTGSGSGNAQSFFPSISGDGRYVAFFSNASDLVAGSVYANSDVYVRDLLSQTTALVSVAADGVTPANGHSTSPVISRDGRSVAFVSYANNLTAAGGAGGNVFVRNLDTATTRLASVGADGSPANGMAEVLDVSADGRSVAYLSAATTFAGGRTDGLYGVYLSRLADGSTTYLGQYVYSNYGEVSFAGSADVFAFTSRRDDLVADDKNAAPDVFVRNLGSGDGTLVSNRLAGPPSATLNGYAYPLGVSETGRYVLFQSDSDGFVSIDRNNAYDVFVRDTQTGQVTLVSVNAGGQASSNLSAVGGSISADGRYVAFQSYSSDIVLGKSGGIFVRDLVAGTTTWVAPSVSETTVISPDGRFVAFASYASSLVAGDTNNANDVFLAEVATGQVRLVSAKADGSGTANGDSYRPVFSGDGNSLAFLSRATNLTPRADTNGQYDLFVRNLTTNVTTLVSAVNGGGAAGNRSVGYEFDLSYDGQYVTFSSDSSDLVPNDLNSVTDIFLRDVLAGTTVAVSAPGNQYSASPSISGDGRYVAFVSAATNLLPGQPPYGTNVFVRDVQTGMLRLVSVPFSNSDLYVNATRAVISDDGRWVAFVSSTQHTTGDTDNRDDLFLRDLNGQTTRQISVSGAYTNSYVYFGLMGISRHGGTVVFTTTSPDLVADDLNNHDDLFAFVDPSNVSVAETATTLTASAAAAVYGQAVTFTAAVAATDAGAATPIGSVTFRDGTAVLGTAALVNGVATLTVFGLAVGSHSVVAVYAGGTSYAASTSSAVGLAVARSTAGVAVAADHARSVFGQSVTFTAAVSAVAPGAGSPSGTVTFRDGTTVLGTVAVVNGTATLTAAGLRAGVHAVTAAYAGDANFTAATGSFEQTVAKAATAVTVTTSASPSTIGGSVQFTATVSVALPGGGVPTGLVTFRDNGVAIGDVALTVNGSVVTATLTLGGLSAGDHTITAGYVGDADFLSADGSVVQVVNRISTVTALSVAPGSAVFGQAVTLTAAVTGNGTVPDGEVTFRDGNKVLGTAAMTNGVATLVTDQFAVGSHALTATYDGGDQFDVSDDSEALQVQKARAAVSVATSQAATVYGQSVTFTAAVGVVAPGAGTPTGTVTFSAGGVTLGTAGIVDGVAVYTTAGLPAGAHSVVAVYAGSGSYEAVAAAAVAQSVAAAGTATALASSATPAPYGQAVTLTAVVTAVAPGTGVPGGQVEFADGGTSLGVAALDAAGVATWTFAPGLGEHAITATYLGTENYQSSVDDVVQVVGQTATAMTGGSSPERSAFGQAVTLRAVVQALSGSAVPTGTVAFAEGGTPLGTAAVDASGVATLTVSTLARGTHFITATYGGEGFFRGSQVGIAHTVQREASTVALASPTAGPTVAGQQVELRATVGTPASGAGTPGGQVAFYDGTTFLGSAPVNNGVASFLARLGAGSHSLTAGYQGDNTFAASSSGAVTRSVNKADTQIVLSGPSAIQYGGAVVFTATVSAKAPGFGTPAGTVTFKIGTQVLGTAGVNAAGQAAFAATGLDVGSHTITASYAESDDFKASTSAAVTQSVAAVTTLATVAASAVSPSTYGAAVTFTATVGTATGVAVPVGTAVTFKDGNVLLGTALLDAAGTATLTRDVEPALSVGTHSVTASVTFAAGGRYKSGTSAPLSHAVTPAGSTTTLAVSGNSVFGQAVTLTATVEPEIAGAVTGTVRFYDGDTAIGSAVTLAGGVATLSVASLKVGGHALTARYSGDANVAAGQSAEVAQTVGRAATAAAYRLVDATSLYGQGVQLEVTVLAVAPGAGAPTGPVTFRDGGTVLGTVPLSGGVAKLTLSNLSVGGHELTADYAGDANFQGDSTDAARTQTVAPADTTSSIAATAAAAAYGQAVQFSATVKAVLPGAGTPTGDVQFSVDGTDFGPAVPLANGAAKLAISTLAAGGHTVTARYLGSASYNGSAVPEGVPLAVAATRTTTTLASSATTAVYGQPVTLTATLKPVAPGAGVPTGTVTFYDGQAVIGTADANGGSAKLIVPTLSIGTHGITAAYAGDGNYAASSVATAVQQVVQGAKTATQLTTSGTPAVYGQAITLTATVAVLAPATGKPSGRVTFKAGAVGLGAADVDAAGVATLTTTTLPVGTHSVTATFGDPAAVFGASTSAKVTQVVAKVPTGVTLQATGTTGTPPTIIYGQAVTLSATVTGLPAGATTDTAGTVTFKDGTATIATAPVVVTADGASATLVAGSLPLGNRSITAVYNESATVAASTSSPAVVQVSGAATQTVLTTTAVQGTTRFGEAVTFRAEIVTPGGVPTGTVTFYDGGTALGSAIRLVNGVAVLTTAKMVVGEHSFTARYAGDAQHTASESAPSALSVERAETQVAVGVSAAATVFGQGVTLTATVSAVAPGAGGPSGTVTFMDGDTVLGTGKVSGGVARLTTTRLAVGGHAVTATYGGDTNFVDGAANGTVNIVVAPTDSTTTLTASTPAPVFRQSVTLTAAVRAVAPGAGSPTGGTVRFYADGLLIGEATAANGVAKLAYAQLAVGARVLTAVYEGNPSFNPSPEAVPVNVTVLSAPTTVTLSSSDTTAVVGQGVTFTATLKAVAPGAGVPSSGVVTFYRDGSFLGTADVVAGVAKVTTTLPVLSGSYAITADYAGNDDYRASSPSNVVKQEVARGQTTTRLTVSPTTSVYGQVVTYTATLAVASPGQAVPTGTVLFYETVGTTVVELRRVEVTGGSGTVVLELASAGAGSHLIRATYEGDANLAPSVSAAVAHKVAAASTRTTLAASPPAAAGYVYGEAITLTAAVIPVAPGGGVPTGVVTFKDGNTVLGTAAVGPSGLATLPPITLAVGNRSITATYSGAIEFKLSVSAVLTLTVRPEGDF